MNLRKKLLKESRLYVILDKKVLKSDKAIFKTAQKLKNSGVDIVQYRDKESKKEAILNNAKILRRILSNNDILLIINDYLDVAKIADCDGVHLGQSDTSLEIARRILDKSKLIGISCHNKVEALQAQERGADYIGVGPIFETATKPEYKAVGLGLIKELKRKINIPFFAIGGINQSNVNKVKAQGAQRVAVCRAVCGAEYPSEAAKTLSESVKGRFK